MRYFLILFYFSLSCFSQESIYKDKTLEIFCKKMDNSYWSLSGNLCEYVIYKNGRKLQTLKKDVSVPNKFYYEDINFDGFKDFRVMRRMTKNPYNIFFIYYIFNPQTKLFHRVREYEKIIRPQYNKTNKEISSILWAKAGERQIIETYNLKTKVPILKTKVIIDLKSKNKYGRIKLKEEYDYTTNKMSLYWETENEEIGSGVEYYTIINGKKKLDKKTITIIGKDKLGKIIYSKENWDTVEGKLKLVKRENNLPKWGKMNFDYIVYDKDKD